MSDNVQISTLVDETSEKQSLRIPLNAIHETLSTREIVYDEAFEELMTSLQQQGLLQPIKVRRADNGYELVYGRRRLAAMRKLGWEYCTAIVEDIDKQQAVFQSIVENLHRRDLSPFEEAHMYSDLQEQGYSVTQISRMISKSTEYIRERLSLLKLPQEVQRLVQPRQIRSSVATAQGVLAINSAARIARVTRNQEEAIHVAQKFIEERLSSEEIRQFTTLLRQTENEQQRQKLLSQPARQNVGSPEKEQRTFHTSNRSLGEQFHAKWLWNLKRIDLNQYQHFTIGYSQRHWSQFLELLEIAGITMLIDARYNPISQYKPEFSKNRLQNALEACGIDYRHYPQLGIAPSERSDLAQHHDYETLFGRYSERLKIDEPLNMLKDVLHSERLAFLCVELDPQTCHRHRIALLLEQLGFQTLDL